MPRKKDQANQPHPPIQEVVAAAAAKVLLRRREVRISYYPTASIYKKDIEKYMTDTPLPEGERWSGKLGRNLLSYTVHLLETNPDTRGRITVYDGERWTVERGTEFTEMTLRPRGPSDPPVVHSSSKKVRLF